jgi:hypothetical protein
MMKKMMIRGQEGGKKREGTVSTMTKLWGGGNMIICGDQCKIMVGQERLD